MRAEDFDPGAQLTFGLPVITLLECQKSPHLLEKGTGFETGNVFHSRLRQGKVTLCLRPRAMEGVKEGQPSVHVTLLVRLGTNPRVRFAQQTHFP
ncbi:MAG: hypothetical protein BWZ07_03026 [Alphaproteobacteria bacterium ADurb.BinA280]|nr:MAG: hypothetical protein BWZ07_03026 [Alphaproteobacteria bacterium ADurb.BinA280]